MADKPLSPPARAMRFNGPALREARKEAKLTILELYVRLRNAGVDVRPSTLRKFEVGQSEPRATTLAVICRILKRRPESMMIPKAAPSSPAPPRAAAASGRG